MRVSGVRIRREVEVLPTWGACLSLIICLGFVMRMPVLGRFPRGTLFIVSHDSPNEILDESSSLSLGGSGLYDTGLFLRTGIFCLGK